MLWCMPMWFTQVTETGELYKVEGQPGLQCDTSSQKTKRVGTMPHKYQHWEGGSRGMPVNLSLVYIASFKSARTTQ